MVWSVWRSSGPETQAPDAPECEPMKYGSQAMISEGFSSGCTLEAAQRMAWEIVISRKSSHASASSSFIFFLKAFSSGDSSAILLIASAVCM